MKPQLKNTKYFSLGHLQLFSRLTLDPLIPWAGHLRHVVIERMKILYHLSGTPPCHENSDQRLLEAINIYRLRIWYITVICFLLLTFLLMIHRLPNYSTKLGLELYQTTCVCVLFCMQIRFVLCWVKSATLY